MRTILISLALFLSINGLAQSVKPDSTQHPVYHNFLKGIDAFNRHDLNEFLDQFADDMHMYAHSGWLRSKKEITERFAGIFKQFPHIRIQMETLNVRPVNDHTVVVDFSCRTMPRGQGPAFHTVGSGVYVWRNDQWVEVFEHETLVKTDEGMFDQ